MRKVRGGFVWAFVFGALAWAAASLLRPLVVALIDPGRNIVARTAARAVADFVGFGPSAGLLIVGAAFVCADRLSGDLSLSTSDLGRALLPRTPQFAVVGLIIWLVAYLSFVLPSIVVSAAVWSLPVGSEESVVEVGAVVLGMLAIGMALTVYVSSRVVLAIPIIVEEHQPLRIAFRDALALSKKNVRRVMGVSVAAALPFTVAHLLSAEEYRIRLPEALSTLLGPDSPIYTVVWLIASVVSAWLSGVAIARAYGAVQHSRPTPSVVPAAHGLTDQHEAELERPKPSDASSDAPVL